MAELTSGKRVILPKTKEHAEAMLLVALAALKEHTPDVPGENE